MVTVPEAVGLLILVGLVLWGVRTAVHAEIDRRAWEHHRRTNDDIASHVLEDASEEEGDGDRR